MKKFIYIILIVAVVASICLVPSVAFAQSVTFYAMSYDGQQLASAPYYSFSATTLQTLKTEAQNNLQSSYASSISGLTYTADFSTLYSDPNLTTPITSSNAGTVSAVYVKYNPQKTITVYQRTVEGVNFGSYTYGPISNPSELFGLTVQSEVPSYASVGLYLDTNWTSLTFDNYSTAFDNGVVYAYYSQNTYVQFFYILNGEQNYIYGEYFSNGQPTTPNSTAVSNAIPSGYKVENWYTDASLTNLVTSFPGASGAGMEFYAKLVEDIPDYTVTVYLSLNNNNQLLFGTYNFSEDDTITLPTPTYEDYRFISYHSGYPCNPQNYISNLGTAQENRVIYAFMQPTVITLRYFWTDSADGVPYLKYTVKVPYGTTPIITQYTDRSAEGYALIKITSDVDGNNIVQSYGPLTQNTDWYCFYAQSVTVSYFTLGTNGGNEEFLESRLVAVGSQAPYISIPVIENYKFIGYATAKGGTITSELPIIIAPTNIYLMYSYSIGEGSTVFIYNLSFTLNDSYTLLGTTYAYDNSVNSVYIYNDLYVALDFNYNNMVQSYAFTNLYSTIETSKRISYDAVGQPVYQDVAVVNFAGRERYTFKFLSFVEITNFDSLFSLRFTLYPDTVTESIFTATVPLVDYDVTSQELTFDESLVYNILKPDIDANGDKTVLSVVGGFVNSISEFFLKIFTYKLFNVFPTYMLIIIPLAVALVVVIVKAFL